MEDERDGGELPTVRVDRAVPVERLDLGNGSWVDIARGWLAGADELCAALVRDVPWQPSQLFRYDHWVEEKRLGAMWRPGTPLPHPGLAEAHRTLQHRYKVQFGGFGLIQYRDGGDGQGFHRDTDMRWLEETVVAILTLGARRPWQLRPWGARLDRDAPAKGAVHDLAPGSGDLLVMGGRCQADWQHSVPYCVGQPMGIRVSIQWRHATRRGRPYAGTSFRAPLNYGRG